MRKCWIEKLPGMPPLPACPGGYSRPDRVTATFIEEGHFVEYFEYPFDRDRTVALFYGPGEFIIRTHPCFSTVQALDRSCVADFTYGNIFRTLRGFPESRFHYMAMKEKYEVKVAERLELAGISCELERFGYVRERQPWVLTVAPEGLVAGYLGVRRERLRELMRISNF